MKKPLSSTALVPIVAETGPDAFKQWKRRFWLCSGERLFQAAIREKRPDFVKILYDKGFGLGAVYKAARDGDLNVLKTLIDAGVDVDEQLSENENRTALIVAAINGRMQAVLILLEANADTERRDNTGDTALIDAAARGHIDIAKALIKAGADPTALGEQNMSARQWAERHKKTDIADLLREYEEKWKTRHTGVLPALPAPPKAPVLSSVWSALQAPGTDLVVQTVDDPAAGISVRHQFDFIARERLTAYSRNGAPPVLTITRFTDLDDGLLQTVNAVRADPAPYAFDTPPKSKLS